MNTFVPLKLQESLMSWFNMLLITYKMFISVPIYKKVFIDRPSEYS